ncbi:hypothetical protein EJ05DRAFT_502011 [Pseudovirgaria hyperparasitica]|uniref:Uncharacterized protein n=1 Tax=Pseudovirgaria hyperparasitica TaxID=470096 RepID=A0A6A6W3B4_9PEZI|nr:uncharacterized protein EJ05DRAFT_502011 [Pseudovirgaria hyperparasitica]KAF2756504.1 hypothetical protein EJ05DRAFT_502011 [Pseudovirgaria hyperparasitica]
MANQSKDETQSPKKDTRNAEPPPPHSFLRLTPEDQAAAAAAPISAPATPPIPTIPYPQNNTPLSPPHSQSYILHLTPITTLSAPGTGTTSQSAHPHNPPPPSTTNNPQQDTHLTFPNQSANSPPSSPSEHATSPSRWRCVMCPCPDFQSVKVGHGQAFERGKETWRCERDGCGHVAGVHVEVGL